MNNDEIFFFAFGVLTSTFSRMEAKLRMLISGIAFGDNSIVASAFLDSSQLIENLRILKKISRQYWDEESQINEIISSIEAIRETRNLFIHGLWDSNNFGELDGFASATDIRTTFQRKNESSRSWEHSQTTNFTINDFQRILDSINEIISKIEIICSHFDSDENNFDIGRVTSKTRAIIRNVKLIKD